MRKRKDFLLLILVGAMIALISFGAGQASSNNSNKEKEEHYLNWYLIGLFDSFEMKDRMSMDNEILDLMKKNPSIEEEREFLNKIERKILEDLEDDELSENLPAS